MIKNTIDDWMRKSSTIQLDLGCGKSRPDGYIGIDTYPGEKVDIVHDLATGIPFPDSSADRVRAYDFVEHLPNKIRTMNEIWRVLKPGGEAEIFVPTTEGCGAFQDPTHVSYWNLNSFLYFTVEGKGYLDLGQQYGFIGQFKTTEFTVYVNGTPWNRYRWIQKMKILWRRMWRVQESLVVHLKIKLKAVKP